MLAGGGAFENQAVPTPASAISAGCEPRPRPGPGFARGPRMVAAGPGRGGWRAPPSLRRRARLLSACGGWWVMGAKPGRPPAARS